MKITFLKELGDWFKESWGMEKKTKATSQELAELLIFDGGLDDWIPKEPHPKVLECMRLIKNAKSKESLKEVAKYADNLIRGMKINRLGLHSPDKCRMTFNYLVIEKLHEFDGRE